MYSYRNIYKYLIILLTITLLISCENTVAEKNCTDNCTYEGEFSCNAENNSILVCQKDSEGCLITIERESCTDGTYCSDGSCVNKCDPECGANSYCGDEKECICNIGYHSDNNSCVSNTKQEDCIDNSPENAKSIIKEVDVTWNEEDNSWNPIADCKDWECNENFHRKSLELNKNEEEDTDSCISNLKKVNCKDIAIINAKSTIVEVEITWDSEKNEWSTPANCSWECIDGYYKDETSCKEDQVCGQYTCNYGECSVVDGVILCSCDEGYIGDSCDVCDSEYQDFDNDGICSLACNDISCTEENTVCDDSSGTIHCKCKEGFQDNSDDDICRPACSSSDDFCTDSINTHCDDSTGAILCNCNSDYHLEGLVCVSNNKVVPCDSSQTPRENASFTSIDVTVTWDTNTNSWSSPVKCEWSCNDSYEYNEDENSCVCPEGTTYNTETNKCLLNECNLSTDKKYLFCSIGKTWEESKELCEKQGFSLVTVNSAAENATISTGIGNHDAWIGLNDIENEAKCSEHSSKWKWVDGVSNTVVNSNTSVNNGNPYWNWNTHGVGQYDEPNNDNNCSSISRDHGEDCVHILGNGKWNDEPCSSSKYFICEQN